MNDLEIKNMNDLEIKNSYVTKDDFINFITGLKFTHVKEVDLEFITGFALKTDSQKIKPLGYHIHIY